MYIYFRFIISIFIYQVYQSLFVFGKTILIPRKWIWSVSSSLRMTERLNILKLYWMFTLFAVQQRMIHACVITSWSSIKKLSSTYIKKESRTLDTITPISTNSHNALSLFLWLKFRFSIFIKRKFSYCLTTSLNTRMWFLELTIFQETFRNL